jgi:hypothetical protein
MKVILIYILRLFIVLIFIASLVGFIFNINIIGLGVLIAGSGFTWYLWVLSETLTYSEENKFTCPQLFEEINGKSSKQINLVIVGVLFILLGKSLQ